MPARIVLCGGIGSGKSTAAAVFERLGAVVLSADDVARRALASGTVAHAAVMERWPEVAVDGHLDRSALGRIVFADPPALEWLESITHPATRTELLAEVSAHQHEDVLVELPILRDWFPGWTTVVVDAPDELRMARAVARSDVMTAADVRTVMQRQPSRSEWLMAADLVVDNRGDQDDLETQCQAVWEIVTSP